MDTNGSVQSERYSTPALRKRERVSPGFSEPVARVLWLRQRRQSTEAIRELQEAIRASGIALEVADVFDVASSQLATADLVLIDAFDCMDGMVETAVARVRLENRVPLVMLTNGYSTEQLITALNAGVDAIWALSTPVEVLLARCKAFLRRWLSIGNIHRSC